MKTEHDHKITRCPKLGDEMTFAYCRREAGDLPCARIITCWQAAFDAASVLKGILSEEQWERFAGAKPKDKMSSLLEIIEQAKRRK
jgi:hypothetical protein